MDPISLIPHVERCAYAAWPAAEVEVCGGWLLRSTFGVTHRANSVWPNHDDGMLPLDGKIDAAESFYAARQRPAIFQMCAVAQPPHLDAVLQARGYTRGRATTVRVARTREVLTRVDTDNYEVHLTDDCDDRWLSVYRRAEGVAAEDALQRQGIMCRISTSAAYAVATRDGEDCAVGSIVQSGTWAGVFNVATVASFRRQGAALAVMAALVRWAADAGTTDMYLQVMNTNLSAWSLYDRLGFSTLYEYHYRFHAPSGAGL